MASDLVSFSISFGNLAPGISSSERWRLDTKAAILSASAGYFGTFTYNALRGAIFLLTEDWSKRVTWANIPQLKLGNNRD